jgi:two-component sensor histidine kinase
VSPDAATPLGLLVNEFVTNSLKHAFGGGPGTVGVQLGPAEGGGGVLVAFLLNWSAGGRGTSVWAHVGAAAGMLLGILIMMKAQEGHVPPDPPRARAAGVASTGVVEIRSL